MAVFMLNVCKFNDCGRIFDTLDRLIGHIEDTHIDFDPRVVEQTEQQQPSCIPLSYVLRFFNHVPKIESPKIVQQTNTNVLNPPNNARPTLSGNEIEETEDCVSELDDSNDSWVMQAEYSPDFIMRYSSRTLNQNKMANTNSNTLVDKPFACPVPGCKKRYKNVNGIRYHAKKGHKNDGKIHKSFQCFCGKSYKTAHGLRNHTSMHHNGQQVKSAYPRPNLKTEPNDYVFDGISLTPAKACRQKVAAIEDHGYMKTECLDMDYDLALGVLTPAASPIKADTASNNCTKYLGVNPSQIHN